MTCKGCFGASFSDCSICYERSIKMEIVQINIKYVKNGIDKIKQIENGDWIDLRVAEDVHLEPKEFRIIPLGVAMALPKGYEALVGNLIGIALNL